MDHDTLSRHLSTLDTTLAAKTRALRYAEQVAGRHARVGDAGWLLSPITTVPGTLMAVVGGQKARRWSGHVSRLRAEVSALSAEKRILQTLLQLGAAR